MCTLLSFPQGVNSLRFIHAVNHWPSITPAQNSDVDAVKTQHFRPPARMLRVAFNNPCLLPPASSPPLPPETTILFSIIFSSQECYVNGIIKYVIFWDWHFSRLMMILWVFFPVSVCLNSFLLLSRISWYGYTFCI